MTPPFREFPVVPPPPFSAGRRLILALVFLAAVLALLWALPSGAEATTDCGPFAPALPRPSGALLLGIAEGAGGVIVAVGEEGTIVRSDDGGVDWVAVRIEAGGVLHDIAWTGIRFVAVGLSGRILESADGRTWRDVSPIPSVDLFAISALPGRVVAVGAGGAIFTSPDGVAWTFVPLPESPYSHPSLFDVATDGTGFLAVGGGIAVESPDGLRWENVETWDPEPWYAVTAVAGGWVAINADGAIRRTADGIRTPSPWPPNYWMWEPAMDVVAMRDGSLLATGVAFPGYPVPPRRSTDGGLSWKTVDTTAVDDGLAALAVRSGGDLLGAGPSGRVARSGDGGRSWTDLVVSTGISFADVAFGGGRFVAVGEPSGSEGTRSPRLATSADGWLWSFADLGRDSLSFDGVAWSGSRWLATGFDHDRLGAVAATSDDGLRWRLHDLPFAGRPTRPLWSGTRWIASLSPHVASSADGASWTLHRVDIPDPGRGLDWTGVEDLATDGSTTVAVTWDGDLVASSDLDHWARRHLGTSHWSIPIAWGAGRFVAPYRHDPTGTVRVLVSSDTFTWYDQASPIDPGDGLTRLSWDGERFVLGTWFDATWESVDGIEWSRVEFPMPIVAAAASEGGTRVAVGNGGIVVADCSPVAQPGADFAVSPESPEAGEPVSFVDRSTGHPTALRWAFGDSAVAEGPAPRHAFATPGNVLVTLEASNASGRSIATRTLAVRATAPPLAAFDASPQPAIVGHPVVFRDRSSGRVGERKWLFGDGVAGTAPEFTRVFLAPGLVRATLVVRNDAGETRVTRPIRVLADRADCAGTTWLDDATRGRTLRRLATSANHLLAVGDEGTALSSPDGTAWRAVNAAIGGEGWERIFVGAASDGTSFRAVTSEEVWTSPDGAHWTLAARISGAFLQGIAFARGRWFALGRGIWSSEDGVAWTERFVPFSGSMFSALADDGRRLVAVGGMNLSYYAFGTVATSVDGQAWLEAELGGGAAMLDVIHDGSRFVAVGNSWLRFGPEAEGWTSADGLAWTRLEGIPSGFMPSCVARTGGDLLLGGSLTEGSPRPGAVARLDGATFVFEAVPPVPPIHDLEPFAGRIVAVGGTGAILGRETPDGSWVELSDASISVLHDVAAPADAPRVAVGNRAIVVDDGSGWRTARIEPLWPLSAVAAGNGRYVAVGRDTLATSVDGLTWTRGLLPDDMPAVDVAFAGDRFVVVAADGTSATSADGIAWTSGTLPPADIRVFRAVAAGDDLIVGVGASGLAAFSPDGVTWTRSDAGSLHDLRDVAFGRGLFVAAGSSGAIFTSRDGARWDWHGRRERVDFEKVVATPGGFAAIASDATGQQRGLLLFTSPDGESWSAAPERLPLPPWGDLEGHGLALDGDRLLVVGPGGTVVSVDCAGSPTALDGPFPAAD